MPSYSSGKFGRVGETGVVISGFAQLQRALRRVGDGIQPELRTRIKKIGDHVKDVAEANVEHKTGRHSGSPTIEAGLKVSVQQRGASVYTTAPHGGVQNVGGMVEGRGPHVKRASASHYMDRAVTTSEAFVEQETEGLLDWLETTFAED